MLRAVATEIEDKKDKRERPAQRAFGLMLVERRRIELPTSALRTQRSPS